jgi:hypothetical protein
MAHPTPSAEVPLSRAYRPFIEPTLKGSKGSNPGPGRILRRGSGPRPALRLQFDQPQDDVAVALALFAHDPQAVDDSLLDRAARPWGRSAQPRSHGAEQQRGGDGVEGGMRIMGGR